MMSSTELDEFGKDGNQTEQKFDPDFPIRRTLENSMAHDAAYAWWTSPSRKQFIHWYEYMKAAFESSEVKASLHKAAMDVEKTVSRLPSIPKLMADFIIPCSGVKLSWDKLGELVYLKSQFWVLRTPKERNAPAKALEAKAATFREKATEQCAGTSSQCPPLTSRVTYQTPGAQHPGQHQTTPQLGAPTSSSTMLRHAGQPAAPPPAQGLDMPMGNLEGNQPPTGN